MHDSTRAQLIERVRPGMKVVDAGGRAVGEVAYVQMGDPEAATTQGAETAATNVLEAFVAIGESEPDVAEPLRSQLLRYGFVKVDGPDLADTDRYVRSDRIARVEGDVVTVDVPAELLPKEE